ncbi:MAG: LVIVD repeat-containing protein [Actinomycetota bacterium]
MSRPSAARRSRRALIGALAVLAALPGVPGAVGASGDGPAQDAVANNFELVGHTPLGNRGMNAALAVHGDYAYVGSRTDGKPWGTTLNLNHAGVMVVNISDPKSPTVVGEIGPPDQALTDQTSREMRVWPEQELLIVQNLSSNCSELIHACAPTGGTPDVFTFYDISGDNAAAPKKVATYDPSSNPHEFFLWVDPFIPGRALIFISATSAGRLLVTDISGARQGEFRELGSWNVPIAEGDLHSMGISNDGMRAYLAHLTGGFAVADTSDFANDLPGATGRLITPSAKRVKWPGPGAHSALKLFGKDYAFLADEVYGDALQPPVANPAHGCPWGWVRMIDIADPTTPAVVAEYKLPQNVASFCDTDPPRPSTSISAHNPTLTPNLAFITWHSGGFQAIDISNPATPVSAGSFVPDPLPAVVQEDPALSAGADKVVMWSYPVIKDGLIYVVDVRNGLYILKYTGPRADEVAAISFLEGNSNLGDALRFEPVDPCLRTPPPPGTICP